MTIWTAMKHPNVCELDGLRYSFPGGLLASMDLCEGGSLRGFLRNHERTGLSIPVLSQAAEVIAAMHAKGVVHSDLRCHHILVASDKPPQTKACGSNHAFDPSATDSWTSRCNGTARACVQRVVLSNDR